MSKNLELEETLDLRWARHMLDFPEEGAAQVTCLQVLGKLIAEWALELVGPLSGIAFYHLVYSRMHVPWGREPQSR